jgi:hypothetical protein
MNNLMPMNERFFRCWSKSNIFEANKVIPHIPDENQSTWSKKHSV